MLDRILAAVHARSIDDRLLAGEPPQKNGQAMARQVRLLDPRYRSSVADALRDLVATADRHEFNFFRAEITIRWKEIIEARALILTLADELEQDQPLSPRGVIMADRLIRDGDSPIYWRSPVDSWRGDTIEDAVKHARAALLLG